MPFKEAFGTYGPVKKANGTIVHEYSLTPLQQSLVSVAIIFIGVGGALAGPIGKYRGRRGAIQAACFLIAVGAGGMLGTAGSYLNYMVCKCIQGLGLGILLAASPLWGAEVLLAEGRGLFLSLFGWGLAVGQTMAGCVCLATSKYTTYLAWQTPIICHIPLAILFGLCTFAFPESPRWLLTKGREAEARRSFATYYGKAIDDPIISYQVQQTASHIEAETAAMKTASAFELLRGVNLRRTCAALIVVLGIALTGIRFITTYAVIFLAGVGVGSPYLVTVIMASCVCVGVIGTPFMMEYLGRRFGLLAGYSTLGIFMLLIAAVGSGLGPQSRVAQLVLVVFLCLWNFVYGLCLSASLATISAEQHSVRLRTNGQALTIVVYEVFAFGLSFAVPYMISVNYGNMGLNIGYMFAGKFSVLLELNIREANSASSRNLSPNLARLLFLRARDWPSYVGADR